MNQINLDPWQEDVLKHDGNLLLISGRRIGKSEILSIDCAEYGANHSEKSLLVISHTERQAYWLFERILAHIYKYYPKLIKKGGKHKPTKSQVLLTNNTIIRCLPTGLTGAGIRGIQADRIYPDECDYIEDSIWQVLTPMLLTTGGVIRGGTTPNPNKTEDSYVYKQMYKNPKFKVLHVSTEEVMRDRKISDSWTEEQRKNALEHLENEKQTMSKLAYACEYLGQWVFGNKRFFPEELIKKCCVLKRPEHISEKYLKFLGVDIARLGDDKSAFSIVEKGDNDKVRMIGLLTTRKTYTTETYDTILNLNKAYNFRKIGIDAGSGSLGVGVLDFLMREPDVAYRVVALNNRSRSLDRDGKSKTKLMKEDMYQNLLAMMEHGKIELLDDEDLIKSLQSVTYETELTPGEMSKNKVFSHINSDITESLIRSAWLANESKSLNFKIYYC